MALPIGRDVLDALVRRIRSSLDPDNDVETAFALAEASRLYRELLASAEALLADKAVWFVLPDGPLESLPLTLLLKTASSAASASHDWRQLAWVGRKHALATLPSVGALALARSGVPPAPAPEALIAFADPVLGPVGKEGTRAVRRALTRGLRGEHRLADPTRLRMLAPLPETADFDDGLLSANEIASLKLNADWVLLSAGNTAAADGTPGVLRLVQTRAPRPFRCVNCVRRQRSDLPSSWA